jgi:hypothetical protein
MNLDALTPTFTDISEWQFLIYHNTGGSRSKTIAQEPITDKEFFFKGSKVIPTTLEIKYPTEFWSEIATSKIGQLFGFNMLDYNIGYNSGGLQKIGCLSESMIVNSQNELTELRSYLIGLDPTYNAKTDKKKYTFQFIESALNHFDLGHHIPNIVSTIVFDALIGNSDRHQENIGIITNYQSTIASIETDFKWTFIKRFLKRYIKIFAEHLAGIENPNKNRLLLKISSQIMNNNIAPIYDSGCSLGREFNEKQIIERLNDTQRIDAYLRKGQSEIHWEGEKTKLSHFDLIERLKQNYPTEIKEELENLKSRYNVTSIKSVINNLDKNLPVELNQYSLTSNRKEFMIKVIDLRHQRLMSLL